MAKSLLDRAKQVRIKEPYKQCASAEEIELALAWLDGQVTNKQVAAVKFPKLKQATVSSSVYSFLVRTLRDAYQLGVLRKQ